MLQNILHEAKRLEDNGVNSSSSQTLGTWQAEELLLKWFVPKTLKSGHYGISSTCQRAMLGGKLVLKHTRPGPVCLIQNPTVLSA